MEQTITIGLDIAKQVFHVHGADASGYMLFCKRLTRGSWLFGGTGIVYCRHGGLRRLPLLGPRDRQAGPHGASYSAGLGQAIREAAEEWCG